MGLLVDVDPDGVVAERLRTANLRSDEPLIEYVPLLGGSLQAPRRYDIFNRGPAGEPSWRMAIVVHEGVPRCYKITMEAGRPDAEVRITDIGGLRIDDMVEIATESVSKPIETDEDGNVRAVPISWEDARSGKLRPAVRAVRRHAKRRVTEELLRQVADVYRAYPGRDATQAVQRYFRLASDRTARDWVSRARKAGHLGGSLRGKAGEVAR